MQSKRMKYVIVAVLAALVAALATGPVGATAAKLITGSDIQNGTITRADIKKESITLDRLTPATQALIKKASQPGSNGTPGSNGANGAPGRDGGSGSNGRDGAAGARGDRGATGSAGATGAAGATGPQGPQGDPGTPGAPGLDGANGISGYEVREYDYIAGGAREGRDGEGPEYGGAGNSSIATVACSSQDKRALSGGWFLRNGRDEASFWMFQSPALGQGVSVTASFPGRMDWSTNTPFPNRLDGWIVQFGGSGPALDVTLYVICANVD